MLAERMRALQRARLACASISSSIAVVVRQAVSRISGGEGRGGGKRALVRCRLRSQSTMLTVLILSSLVDGGRRLGAIAGVPLLGLLLSRRLPLLLVKAAHLGHTPLLLLNASAARSACSD